MKTQRSYWFNDLPISKKILTMGIVMVSVTVTLLVIVYFSLFTIKGVRAYVEGEGLWSKGQKDAVYYLTRYAHAHDPQDYLSYQKSVAIPLVIHQGRVELEKATYDFEKVKQAFVAAGIAEQDIPSMAFLFRMFGDNPYLAKAISIWIEADRTIFDLNQRAVAFYSAHSNPHAVHSNDNEFIRLIEVANGKLTPLEQAFSESIVQGAQYVERTLLIFIITSTSTLLGLGLWLSILISRQIYREVNALRSGALRFGEGDLSTPIAVMSRDELGALAETFNAMVSLRHEEERTQEKEREFQNVLLNNLTEGIVACDESGVLTLFNRATREIHGLPEKPLSPDQWAEYFSLYMADGRTPLPKEQIPLYRAFQGENVKDAEIVIVSATGQTRIVVCNGTALYSKERKKLGAVIAMYDITERKRTEAAIMHMAHHDALTGLPNRTLLMDRINMAIRQAHRSNRLAAVLMLDLDQFKRINDTLGHHAGDELLTTVAQKISKSVRESDTVARLGGDEFVVLLTDIGSREEVQSAIDKLSESIAEPVLITGNEIAITPSVGCAVFPYDGKDAHTILKNADTAMYVAKATGRNNNQWYRREMSQDNERRLVLSSALKSAIEEDQFCLHYQPEIDLVTGRTIGVEALLRWKHPSLGAISPEVFIPIAEETGLILSIGEWVLRKACLDIVDIEREHGHRLNLAVNVSPRQFQQSDWIDIVRSVLKESGVRPSQLELEITEGMLMENPKESASILRNLRGLGAAIVVDDFGTGYSSLSYLTRFPVDKLKIDRSFVRDLATDATDAAVIDAIIAMSHSLNIRVIAEGIETQDQLTYLINKGCDEGQGFYFGKGVPRSEIVALLQDFYGRPKS